MQIQLARMPLNSKKGAASYSIGGTRVPTAPLVSCLTCPLCTNLFRDATTISECLHTFCRECIHNRLNDGETNTCPVCNVSLGTVPLEKLRADHQLNDVKLKLFPEITRKRKNGPSSSPAVSGAPTRRRERSLYSLGIGAQPSLANPGFATRTTRRSSGKSVAGRDSTSSDDEHEEVDEMDDEDEEMQTEDDESQESQGVLPDPASPIAASNSKGYHVELSSDDEEIFPPRPSRAKEEPRRAPVKEPPRVAKSEVGMYHAHRSMITANGFSRTRSGNYSDAVASAEGPFTAGGATQDERNSSADSLLATLAEVAGADSSGASRAKKSSQAEPPRAPSYGLPTASPDLIRVRDANNDAKSMDVRSSGTVAHDVEGMTLRASPPRARRSSPHLQKNHHSLKAFANGSVERPGILKHPTLQHPPSVNGSYLASTSFGTGQCGIWFALQAARNQSESPLPQLSSPYLRIKDGKLPVSHVKKYLVKKLGLNNETEVEITCRGQPVVSSLPLESVRNIWFATAVPTSKDQDDQSQTSSDNGPTGLMHLDNSSAKELIMVLTYQRHRRNPRIC